MTDHLSRRGFLQTAGLGIAALGAGTLLSGCSHTATTSPSASAGPVQKGGTLTVGQIGYGNSETMNLAMLNSAVDILRQSAIREGLWEYRGKSFGVANVLAESQDLSTDGKTLTVHLRQGVTWHDGKPFTADDVVWNVSLWKDEPALAGVASVVDFPRLKKVDQNTVEIGLTMAIADFPGIAASSWSTYLVQNGTKYTDKTYVGTGPYVFSSFKPGRAEFTANKNYWGDGPYLDRLVSDSSYTGDDARYNALLAGTIDVMPAVPYTLARTASSNGSIRVMTSPQPGNIGISVRVDKPPFNDPRVMQALKLVEKRETYRDSAFNGYATLGNDLAMNGAPYFASDLKRDYDPEQAKSLLKAAGAEGLAVPIVTSAYSAGATELATIYAQQASEAGMKLTVAQIDPSDFYSSTGKYPYMTRTMGINSWTPNTLSGYYVLGLYTKAPYNDTHWGDAETDALLFDALGEQDPDKATVKWHAVQQQQFDRGGYLIPVQQDYVDAVRSNVYGLNSTPSGANLDNYNLATAWKSSK